MSIAEVLTGTRQTLAFGTMIGTILSVNWAGLSRDSIDVTPRGGDVKYRRKQPGSYVEPGVLSFEMQYNGTTAPLITGAIASLTLTAGDGTSSLVLVADGFLTSFEFASPDEDQLIATGSIQIDDTPTVTAA